MERKVLVPVEPWYGNAIDLYAKNVSTDVGAFAEALVYYDTVFLNIAHPAHMESILQWFSESASPEDFVSLMQSSDLFIYYYDFYVNPIFDPMVEAWLHVNIQEEPQGRLSGFRQKMGVAVQDFFRTRKRLHGFWETIESSIIVAKAADFGNKVNDSKQFIYNDDHCSSLVRTLLASLQAAGFISECPEVEVAQEVDFMGRTKIIIKPNLEVLGKRFADKFRPFGPGTLLAMAAATNRLLWSAGRLQADVYATSPKFDFLCSTVEEAVGHIKDFRLNVSRLNLEVDFPNIRQEVNDRHISARQVLVLRDKAHEFRKWLHRQTDLDKDVLNAYYRDVLEKSGMSATTRRLLNIAFYSVLQMGAAAPGAIAGNTAASLVGVGAGAAISFVAMDIFKQLTGGWNPKIFGDAIRKVRN